ncbi:HDIG domain-containing metalloprotein [Clostridium sp.]|uniref:HDIG domain-containing metalloprotein n=1 Tax=Clostridium sp. TaxID=1506 RepID=UPI003217747C
MSRINQFVRCISAKLNEEDNKFIERYLNEDEKKILYKLPIYDIKHSINVAKDIIKNESFDKITNSELNYNELIKSAILHDVGKSYRPLSPIDKSIVVLLNNFTNGKIKKYSNKSSRIYIYFNHGEVGYNILRHKGYSKEFLDTIKNHHNYNEENSWLEILRKYDDRN